MKPLLLTLALTLSLPVAHAQQEAVVGPTPYVFHAYSNALQIPVLTLSPNRRILPPSTPLHFAVSLDGGPPFPIRHVRLEDGDPISLSIVFDMSGGQKHLVDALDETTVDKTAVDETIENWVRQSLRPIDHVSVYAMDCTLRQTAVNIPAAGNTLTRAISTAIHSTLIHQKGQPVSGCISTTTALSNVVNQMSKLRGRRVILAVGRGKPQIATTAGEDLQIGAGWRALTASANTTSVAIFGLEDSNSAPVFTKDQQDQFDLLCQRSGGLLFSTDPDDAEAALEHFIALVRGRYIVEFPRPNSLLSGWHLINVTLTDTKVPYFIRPSGASVPAADPSVLTDPTTLASDPSNAPIPGQYKDPYAHVLHPGAMQAQIKDDSPVNAGADILQIPVLAFAKEQKPIPAGTALPFLLSINGAAPAPVQQVRPEEADPISLAIVLDVSGDQKRIINTIDTTIANFVSQSLHKPDYVSVYAVDCSMIQTADDVKADGAAIEQAVKDAMRSTTVEQSTSTHQPGTMYQMQENRSGCMGHGEALRRIAEQLYGLEGRHVILAVGSHVLYGRPYPDFSMNINDPHTWQDLIKTLHAASVTVFGLEEGDPYTATIRTKLTGFDVVCQRSGGIVLSANQKDVAAQLQHFVDLLRGRYILEFKKPENATQPYQFAVSLGKTKDDYFIYPSGFTLPIGDGTSFDDPPAAR